MHCESSTASVEGPLDMFVEQRRLFSPDAIPCSMAIIICKLGRLIAGATEAKHVNRNASCRVSGCVTTKYLDKSHRTWLSSDDNAARRCALT